MINRANETIPPPLSHDIDNRMRLRITLRILFLFIGCVFLSVPLRYPLIRWKSIVHSRESSSRDEILQILDVITMGSVSSFLGRVQITSSCSRVRWRMQIQYSFFLWFSSRMMCSCVRLLPQLTWESLGYAIWLCMQWFIRNRPSFRGPNSYFQGLLDHVLFSGGLRDSLRSSSSEDWSDRFPPDLDTKCL